MIKETLKSLNAEQRELLMVALEGGFAQIIELEGSFFIGVNIPDTGQYQKIEEKGYYVYGRLVQTD